MSEPVIEQIETPNTRRKRKERHDMRTKLLTAALVAVGLVMPGIAAAQVVPAPDLINTWVYWEPAGPNEPPIPQDETYIDFSTSPIPAGFFGPGSDPFVGRVYMRGDFDGSLPGNTDTVIQRASDPEFTGVIPETAPEIPIQIEELHLTSVEPIRVNFDDGTVRAFDVFVTLTQDQTSQGQLIATKTNPNGGTFDSFFDIWTDVTFTNMEEPTDEHTLSLGPIPMQIQGAPWVENVTLGGTDPPIVQPGAVFVPFVADDGTGTQTEQAVDATTAPTWQGPIIVHHICLPKLKDYCIYQIDCKSAPATNPLACGECAYKCDICRGSPCPNGTCSTGFTATCPGTECCLNFTNIDCRPPFKVRWCPKVTQACQCDPTPGACCLPDGTCTETTECQCSGTWLGAGTVCGPVQSCCLPDGSCLPQVAQACCELEYGGTSTPNTCTGVLGKCCSDDGTCVDGVDGACCQGSFIPGGTCLPPEECCFGTSCIMMDPECCQALGGDPGGVGSACDPVEKCCLGNGQCMNAEPDCCTRAGGIPGAGLCQPQACCLPDGSCQDLDPDCCQLEGGTPHTGQCQPVQACCMPDDSCAMLEPNCCLEAGGTPEGAGSSCDPVGACCWDTDGDSVPDQCKDMAEECCNDITGSSFHANETCADTGVCCYDADGDGVNETCTTLSQACCSDIPNSHFAGVGTTCTGSGACCYDTDGDGISESCNQMDAICCADLPGGTFHGVGSTCGGVGACCYDADGDGVAESCDQLDATCCADLAVSTFHGVGSVCAGDADNNGIDDLCENGGGNPCPLASDWCQNRAPLDCTNGLAGELCWPRKVHLDTTDYPVVDQCDCMGDECGPVDITPIGTPPAYYSFRCVNTCPNPGEVCQIHYNGSPTGLTFVDSYNVPYGVTVTCECPSNTTDPCPLFEDPAIDPCVNLQQTDCKNGATNEVCRPRVAVITSSGLPVAKTCDCFLQDGQCGPVTINGDLVSCEEQCPPPLTGQCMVKVNGVSTGLTSVHYGDVPVGADLTCGCDEPASCAPNAAQDACEGTCPDSTQICAPQCVEYDPNTGISKVVDCNCDGQGECHVEFGAGITPFCTGDCPPGKICTQTVTTDPTTGVETICCDCVDNPDCGPADDGLSCKPTTCPDPSEQCVPQVIVFDPLTLLWRITACDCQNEKLCHVDVDTADPNLPIICTGDCPSGETCEQFTSINAAGEFQLQCDCVPVQDECRPTDDRTDCVQTTCPDATQICRPSSVIWLPGTQPHVNECDCVDPNTKCHVEFDPTGPYCVGECPAGETCELFGTDSDNDGIDDLWRCDCVPVQLECGPDPTGQWCNPVECPDPNEKCVPIVIDFDPFNGQARVKECECLNFQTDGCHVTYDPATLQPYCEGQCPPGETCELFGIDLNGDGVNDRFSCDCVPDTGDCAPNADGSACQQTVCTDPTLTCKPNLVSIDPATGVGTIIDCDCVDDTHCHVEYDAANGPYCVGDCPAGQTCELQRDDSDGDGIDDTFACECVPDTSGICEPNATRTDCKQTDCAAADELCRPTVISIGSNGQVIVDKCDCLNVDEDCHVEFDAVGQPFCTGICPAGETCELLGKDTDNDGINDKFKCTCVPPASECQPDSSGLDCAPTICPNPGEICRPNVISWIPGATPKVEECDCIKSDNECHVEFDPNQQAPYCVGDCPDGTECRLSGKDSDGDGVNDRWSCDCIPIGGQCAPTDDLKGCRQTQCPIAGEQCIPQVIRLDPVLGTVVDECGCADPTLCHLERDAADQPYCAGDCPTGMECKLFGLDVDGDGTNDRFRCDCVPIELTCEPTADGLGCNDVTCDNADERCESQQVTCTANGDCRVTACGCSPDQCHVVLNPPLTDPPAHCEGTCPDGYNCLLLGATDIVTGQTTYTCTCIKKPVVVVPSDPILKGRYLSINRSQGSAGGNGGVAGAPLEIIRVKAVDLDGYPAFDGAVQWAGPPFDAPDENSNVPNATMRASALQCEPYFHDWPSEGVINIFGSLIVPKSTYHVQVATSDCPDLNDEGCYSDVAVFQTGAWGDVVEPFDDGPGPNPVEPDFTDINSVVLKFLADPSAPPKAQAQLQPNIVFPGRPIDFRDISAAVDGFLGTQYGDLFHGPCSCPSLVTCGATACSFDSDCGSGLCVGGFCRDECGLCAP